MGRYRCGLEVRYDCEVEVGFERWASYHSETGIVISWLHSLRHREVAVQGGDAARLLRGLRSACIQEDNKGLERRLQAMSE